MEVKVGIIGGSGLYSPEILENVEERIVTTPFGEPSDALICGTIKGIQCVLLARHSRSHSYMPTNINYRANIWALKEAGCTHVIVSTACGSLQEEIAPGELVILDQFIDRTTKRAQTFYDGTAIAPRGICHLPMDEPFCPVTRNILIESAKDLGIKVHTAGTCITIEGPRFSSKAESRLFRSWGAHVINMTTVPEVILAKEAGLCYAAVAMATDYDCWHEHKEKVNVDLALNTFKENVEKVTAILVHAVSKIAQQNWDDRITEARETVRTNVLIK